MKCNHSTLLYTLAGLVAGVAVGILIAPAPGNDTRRRLKYSAETIRKRLGLDAEDFSDTELEMDATNGRQFGWS